MTTRIVLGNSWESFVHMPPNLARELVTMGTRFIRVFVFWNSANPSPGVFDWKKIDADIDAVRSAGMVVYANVIWAPAHASEGKPTYLPYTDGCSAWNTKHAADGIRFASERDYCARPAHIDPNATFAFAKAFAERYGRNITYWGIGNEPGIQLYWPPRRESDGWPDTDRLIAELIEPFNRGVRSVFPDALFVGPEADSSGVFGELARKESEAKAQWYDVFSFHPYGANPEETLRRVDKEFLPEIENFRGHRDVWISEMGFDENGPNFRKQMSDFMGEIANRPAIKRVSFHSFAQWFAPGTVKAPDGLPVNPSAGYVPNDINRDMRERIGRG
jgi:hypothetical protein